MPAFVVPARSGAHRVAAIALYRALLTQCSPAASPRLPLADDQRAALRNIIRNKFRRNRHVHSARHLKLSFTAGYELLDTLDRASSTTSSTYTTSSSSTDEAATTSTAAATTATTATSATTLLTHLLTTAPPYLTRSPYPTAPRLPPKPPPTPTPTPTPTLSPSACPPPHARVLATRPRPAAALGGTGVRRVPRLVSANLFPMLRLRKPQPRSLSRVLTDKIKQRQRRLDIRKAAADEWAVWGVDEDVWDRLVGVAADEEDADGGGGKGRGREEDAADDGDGDGGEGLSWAAEPERLVRMISAQLGRQKRETASLVERMQDIVDRETALAKVEREARRKRREVARMGGKRMEEVEAISGGRKTGGGGGGSGGAAAGRRDRTGGRPL